MATVNHFETFVIIWRFFVVVFSLFCFSLSLLYPQWGSEQKYFLYFPNISEVSAILKSLIHHAKSVQVYTDLHSH